MKNYFLLFLLFCTTANVYTQDFAPIGAKWHYTHSNTESFLTIESVGDTTIDLKTCQILQSSGIVEKDIRTYIHSFEGKVEVYFNKNFYTLFDFNAQPGESWIVPNLFIDYSFSDPDSFATATVDSIDFETINNVNAKVLYVSIKNVYRERWQWGNNSKTYLEKNKIVEYLGPMEFMFPTRMHMAPEPIFGLLRCYEDNNIGFYETGKAESCTAYEPPNIISVEKHNLSSLSIFPNPATDFITISGIEASSPVFISILNIQGGLIENTMTLSSEPVNISHLSPGLYFLKINSPGSVHIEKFIKR
jgi:hypothetical protein